MYAKTSEEDLVAFDQEKVLRKIKGLLNKAEDPSVTPEEAELLSAKAAELMASYSVDMAMVDAARSKSERETPGRHTESFRGVPYGPRKLVLLNVIAQAYGCDAIRTNGNNLVLFGFQSDLDLVVMLYYSLLVQAERALAKAQVPFFENARSFRTSWWAFYTSEVGKRITEAANRAKKEAAKEPGTALVLADRSLAVHDAAKAEFPQTRRFYVGGGTSHAGAKAGRVAGQNADIGTTRIGTRATGALA